MYHEIDRLLSKAGIPVARSLVGNYITSLDMAGMLGHPAQARRRAAPPVGRSGEDARRCGGACDTDARGRDDGDRSTAVNGLARGVRAGGRGQPRPAHRARLGHRRRRPRRQPRPRHRPPSSRRSTASTSPPPGDAVQDHRDDAGEHGRRRQRTAVRHALPAHGRRRRVTPSRSTRPRSPPRCAPGSRASSRVGRAEAGDKTMFDALAPACDALDAALADGCGIGRRRWRLPPRPPRRAGTRPSRCSRARAARRTSASAASVTRTRARRRPTMLVDDRRTDAGRLTDRP